MPNGLAGPAAGQDVDQAGRLQIAPRERDVVVRRPADLGVRGPGVAAAPECRAGDGRERPVDVGLVERRQHLLGQIRRQGRVVGERDANGARLALLADGHEADVTRPDRAEMDPPETGARNGRPIGRGTQRDVRVLARQEHLLRTRFLRGCGQRQQRGKGQRAEDGTEIGVMGRGLYRARRPWPAAFDEPGARRHNQRQCASGRLRSAARASAHPSTGSTNTGRPSSRLGSADIRHVEEGMPRPFARRTFDTLTKDAKRWLAQIAAGDGEARARFARLLPDGPAPPTLRDVQLALAREQGFEGWTALKRALEPDPARSAATLAEYEVMAAALLEAYRTGTPEAMERHYRYTWHRRAWSGMRTYVQLDLGKRPGEPGGDVAITLDDARYLVAHERGFESWEALRGSVANLPGGAPHVTTVAEARTQRLRELLDRSDTIELDLSGVREVTDDTLAAIGRLARLERLNLSGTSVTDAGVAHLRHCDALRDVNLAWTYTGDGALRALAGKPHLHSFQSGAGVTDDGIALLHEWPVFKTWQGGEERLELLGWDAAPNFLMLRGPFTDRGIAQLRGLDGLFALNVDDARLAITAACLDTLRELPRLAKLAVEATDAWMPGLATLPHLRFLGIQDSPASDEGWVQLAQSRTIEKIWGRRCHGLADAGFLALSRMPRIRGLSVSCLSVSDAAVAALPDFPALRELMPMDIPDAGYRHVGRCRDLESLILMYCRDTTDAATGHITGLSKLSYYFNSYTTITDRTPEILSTMDSLERITFDACHGLTDAGIAHLARLPRLRELSVAGRGVTAAMGRPFPPTVAVTRIL